MTSAPAGPRVLVVDDHAIFRSGVRAELEGFVQVVGEAGTVAEAVELARTTQPDVVLLDVHMPDGGGLAVLRGIASELPGARFLALSVSDSPEDVIELVRAGARGYVTKTVTPAELADAIVRVAAGEAVFSPRLAGFVLDAFSDPDGAASTNDAELDRLTPREQEVLEHIARGYLYKEIALQLGVSTRTVESHVSAVLRKLSLTNRHQLARWATQHRLLD
jgi:DNA-binding NarL/FixJ family response regulator